MSRIVEVDEHGTIRLPLDELPHVKPHSRFEVEEAGEGLILRPAQPQPSSTQRTPEEWSAAVRDWVEFPRPSAPSLSDEAVRRENIY